jgi:hypothetical protein
MGKPIVAAPPTVAAVAVRNLRRDIGCFGSFFLSTLDLLILSLISSSLVTKGLLTESKKNKHYIFIQKKPKRQVRLIETCLERASLTPRSGIYPVGVWI